MQEREHDGHRTAVAGARRRSRCACRRRPGRALADRRQRARHAAGRRRRRRLQPRSPPRTTRLSRGATVPAPRRGELVRVFGEHLRRNKAALGRLVTLESGKILQEGQGEVQEMIDICDFAVGLSRQLYGLTIASERPGHRMMETWHPAGVVAIISAFNFPVAVWSWNAALALVCGDAVVWKPSEKTPLTALACQALLRAGDGRGRRRPGGAVAAWSSAARTSARALVVRPARRRGLGDRQHADGARRRAAHGAPVRAHDPRARRQQRVDRGAVGRPRSRAARDRLLRGRHGGPALHVAAPPDRARIDLRRPARAASARPTPACRSAIRWSPERWSDR